MTEPTQDNSPPRYITEHQIEGVGDLNQHLTIYPDDKPGHGGASHDYKVEWPAGAPDAAPDMCGPDSIVIRFQNGPISEAGVNGISHEALLAIIIDRLESFQAGEYICLANQHALNHCKCALEHLHARTRQRIKRGVEGTSKI